MKADWEERRLAALAGYRILGTPREDSFDEIAKLAADTCGTSMGAVNLVGRDGLFLKAEVGLGLREIPLESDAFVSAILAEDFLLVPDASRDPRFRNHALVTGEPGLRFYAGALLKTRDGLPIGSLCVLDYEPRAGLSELQQRTLKVLARQVMDQLDLRQINDTLEQRVDEALAERRWLAEIVERTNAIVQVVGTDWRWIAVNGASVREYERLFGFRPAVGESMLEVLGRQPIDFEGMKAIWTRALAGEEFVETREFGNLQGERRFYEMRFDALRDAAGELIGTYQFVYDVTDRLREQQRLAEAEEALRQAQKMEAVGQLTGGLAHDFNNLLAGISGAFEMIGVRLSQGRGKDIEKYLNAGQGAARRAAALTHRLLAFSRRQTLSPRPIDVNRLMAELVELIRQTVGPGIEVESVAAGGLWRTMVDANQLENAIINLCINARDAMPGGGKITIETSNKWLDHRSANERGIDPGQYVTVCVSDTGTGIEKDVLGRVFDPFFTTKPIGEGTGLGLSMVYGFARQSNGHVRIYSEVGQGTMVCIYLPRHAGKIEEEPADPSGGTEPVGSGERILIVDDEPTVRMLLADTLGELGYECIEAADGPSGLRLLEGGGRFDLLITDVGLPGGLNGRQVADAARQIVPDMKVLFITGYAENAVLNHGHIPHGMEVVTKPFAVDDIAARVDRLLHK